MFATAKNEKKYAPSKDMLVFGIDEVGRGPLAGPITVAGVILGGSINWERYNISDSKQCTKKKRDTLSPIITKNAQFFSIMCVSVEYINTYGIVAAFKKGIEHVVKKLYSTLGNKNIVVLIDGSPIQCALPYTYRCVVKGDETCISIAAASIIAKVHRDKYMKKIHVSYPGYHWNTNKGYGTKAHREAITSLGITPHHRVQFIHTR
ncbi:ribonuclease HII [Candidatus Woesebacteria bacterium]|nr:ribonuclease HII [Candidatus Woesebacteria bacterium]